MDFSKKFTDWPKKLKPTTIDVDTTEDSIFENKRMISKNNNDILAKSSSFSIQDSTSLYFTLTNNSPLRTRSIQNDPIMATNWNYPNSNQFVNRNNKGNKPSESGSKSMMLILSLQLIAIVLLLFLIKSLILTDEALVQGKSGNSGTTLTDKSNILGKRIGTTVPVKCQNTEVSSVTSGDRSKSSYDSSKESQQLSQSISTKSLTATPPAIVQPISSLQDQITANIKFERSEDVVQSLNAEPQEGDIVYRHVMPVKASALSKQEILNAVANSPYRQNSQSHEITPISEYNRQEEGHVADLRPQGQRYHPDSSEQQRRYIDKVRAIQGMSCLLFTLSANYLSYLQDKEMQYSDLVIVE
jgi:hypothetical protein